AASADGKLISRRSGGHVSPPEPCIWAGAAELVAPPRAQLGTLLDAERYLVLLERGRPSRYHLVQSHVAAALGSGGSLDDCRRWPRFRLLTRSTWQRRCVTAATCRGSTPRFGWLPSRAEPTRGWSTNRCWSSCW